MITFIEALNSPAPPMPGVPGGPGPPGLPIDSNLIVLFSLAILLGIYYNLKTKKNTNFNSFKILLSASINRFISIFSYSKN